MNCRRHGDLGDAWLFTHMRSRNAQRKLPACSERLKGAPSSPSRDSERFIEQPVVEVIVRSIGTSQQRSRPRSGPSRASSITRQSRLRHTIGRGDAPRRTGVSHLSLLHLPVLRHLAEPLDARGLEARRGVEAGGAGGLGREAARHRARDQRRAVLLEPLDEQPLLRHERVDALRLPVEVRGDGALFVEGWEGEDLSSAPCRSPRLALRVAPCCRRQRRGID